MPTQKRGLNKVEIIGVVLAIGPIVGFMVAMQFATAENAGKIIACCFGVAVFGMLVFAAGRMIRGA
jgi:hypothetical protein